jgi:hypothetical protein
VGRRWRAGEMERNEGDGEGLTERGKKREREE